MATVKWELYKQRADGTYNICIRVQHRGAYRRLPTPLYAHADEVTRSGKLRNYRLIEQAEALCRKCRDACNGYGYSMLTWTPDELAARLKRELEGGDRFRLPLLAYMDGRAAAMPPNTGKSYMMAARAVRRYIQRDDIDANDITADWLRGFEAYLGLEPSLRGNNRNAPKPGARKGGRAVSAYIACIRATLNAAKRQYNDEDRGIINIPGNPFKHYRLRPQPVTRKRALTVAQVQAIIDLPYEVEDGRQGKRSRRNLAKDCFILSFCLVGINSADLYTLTPARKGVYTYERAKTRSRRADKAEMRVIAEQCLARITAERRDHMGDRAFDFYLHYSSADNFNKAINLGLKEIGAVIGVEGLQYYAARHSWATIARSAACGVDKYTVHEALNHASEGAMRVTDIYISRDWSLIWEANKKVLSLFDWSAIGWDLT